MTKRGEYLAIDQIHESTTNPRRTFDESKLRELAESIRANGLIQPITVRPNNQGFEIVAGARRYRASQLAELFSVPVRIVEIDDAKALEWQLIENSQRVDVHPYEEAQGFQRLLDIPGYDVAALVEKSGKSASHVYARLSLLQLIPTVAEAFTQERITASHANLIARLPQESQAAAFEQCWRKDWQDKEPHLLPAKHVAAWIQANLYLSLADAPFDREDPTLNPAAGACVTCPHRSGYNTALFADVVSDQCLDSSCYNSKVEAFLDREIAAHPGLVQIENGWRNPKEQRPGAVQRGHIRELPTVTDNLDAEPVMPCAAAKPAIIVYGKNIGAKLTVCTDKHCPVHDPQAAAEAAANPAPTMATASCALASVRAGKITSAPCRASSSAVWKPMPLLAPVITTRRPSCEGISRAVHGVFIKVVLSLSYPHYPLALRRLALLGLLQYEESSDRTQSFRLPKGANRVALQARRSRPPASSRQTRLRSCFRETPWAAIDVASQASHTASRSAKAARATRRPPVPRKMRRGGCSASTTCNTAGRVA
jgi:ParB/RepB/Spo0J family partition protein